MRHGRTNHEHAIARVAVARPPRVHAAWRHRGRVGRFWRGAIGPAPWRGTRQSRAARNLCRRACRCRKRRGLRAADRMARQPGQTHILGAGGESQVRRKAIWSWIGRTRHLSGYAVPSRDARYHCRPQGRGRHHAMRRGWRGDHRAGRQSSRSRPHRIAPIGACRRAGRSDDIAAPHGSRTDAQRRTQPLANSKRAIDAVAGQCAGPSGIRCDAAPPSWWNRRDRDPAGVES